MQGAVHVDLSLVAADAVNWPGDRKLLARNAVFPDAVASVAIEQHGAHLFGRNLEPLTHFCRMVDQTPIGWGLKFDPSLPHLDISNKKVLFRPVWPWPVDLVLQQSVPLAVLLRTLNAPETRGTTEADCITFPAASTMAAWCETVIHTLPKDVRASEQQEARDIVAGWALHYIEDCAVPHHAGGMLLAGHDEFEVQQAVMWQELRAKDAPYFRDPDPQFPVVGSLRGIAERCARASWCSKRTLELYWRFWNKGWRGLMLDSLIRGLDHAIVALRLLGV